MSALEVARRIARLYPCPIHGPGCDDLEQTAFCLLLKAAQLYDPDANPAMPFADYVRRYLSRRLPRGCESTPPKRRLRTDSLPSQVAAPGTGQASDWDEEIDALPRAIGVILRLRYPFEGVALTRKEVAARFGLTVKQVRLAELKGLHILRQREKGQKFPGDWRQSA
jgi:hypothetical protein